MKRPQWDSTREPDLDPDVEAVVRKVRDAVDRLRTATIRLADIEIDELFDRPTEVTEEFIAMVAAMDSASPGLKAYAERVANGECRWSDIESLAHPLPPEVTEMRSSPRFVWPWSPEPAHAPPPPARASSTPDVQRPRLRDTVVGPSDWPDDFEEYPTERRW